MSTYRKTDAFGWCSLCEPQPQYGTLNYPHDTTRLHPGVTAHTLTPPAGCKEVFLSQHSSAQEEDEYLVLRRLGFLNSYETPLINTCLVVGFYCLLSFIVDLTVTHSFILGISSLHISFSFLYFL